MEKVMFVINKPKSCEECPLCNTCNLTGKEANRVLSKSCHLKPVPKEEEIPIDAEIMYSWYLKGYNECLRLLKGEEQ